MPCTDVAVGSVFEIRVNSRHPVIAVVGQNKYTETSCEELQLDESTELFNNLCD